MAWKATGRACVVACFLPQASVQGMGSSNACSKAAAPSSCASLTMRAAGMPVIAAAHSGVHGATALAQELERGRDAPAVGQRVVALERRGRNRRDAFGIGRLDPAVALVEDQLVVRMPAVAGRALRRVGVVREHAFAIAAGSSSTSCGALVKRLRKAWSMRSVAISSCSSAMKSAPSVPGLIGIHSSAIAE
jgi:hypothetical protein